MNVSCWAQRTLILAVLGCAAVGNAATAAAPDTRWIYTLRLGGDPTSVVNGVFFDGTWIWVAISSSTEGIVAKLDRTGTVLAATPVGGNPLDIAFDGVNIWVTDYSSSDLAILDRSGAFANAVHLDPAAHPEGIVFDGKYIWIANNGANTNTVTKIDAVSKTVVGSYGVGRAPDGVAYDGTHIWVTNSYSNDVWTLDRDTGQQIAAYATGTFPLAMVYDGKNMWIGNGTGVLVGPTVPGTGSLTKIRAADGANVGTFTIGHHVRGLTYDGESIWASNANDNTVSRVRASDVALLATYPTGKRPSGVAFDGANIWVANDGENSLTIIAPNRIRPTPGSGHPPGTAPPLEGLMAAGIVHMQGAAALPNGVAGATNAVAARPVHPAGNLRSALSLLLDGN